MAHGASARTGGRRDRRESTPGKREVWYRITDRGRDLAPVVEGLANWGIKHAMRDPLPGEPLYLRCSCKGQRCH